MAEMKLGKCGLVLSAEVVAAGHEHCLCRPPVLLRDNFGWGEFRDLLRDRTDVRGRAGSWSLRMALGLLPDGSRKGTGMAGSEENTDTGHQHAPHNHKTLHQGAIQEAPKGR